MPFSSFRSLIFIVLSGFFICNAITAELIGGKLIQLGPFTLSIGILPWPFVFLCTDLLNEYFGKEAVKKLSYLTSILIIYAFVIIFLAISVKAASFSPVNDEQFLAVFGQSLWIIVGSIIAFLVSQLVDVYVFTRLKVRFMGKYIGLRATLSTMVSQLIDSFIVLGIAFLLPGKISLTQFINLGFTNYSFKLIIAVLLTPAVYALHSLLKKRIEPVKLG